MFNDDARPCWARIDALRLRGAKLREFADEVNEMVEPLRDTAAMEQAENVQAHADWMLTHASELDHMIILTEGMLAEASGDPLALGEVDARLTMIERWDGAGRRWCSALLGSARR